MDSWQCSTQRRRSGLEMRPYTPRSHWCCALVGGVARVPSFLKWWQSPRRRMGLFRGPRCYSTSMGKRPSGSEGYIRRPHGRRMDCLRTTWNLWINTWRHGQPPRRARSDDARIRGSRWHNTHMGCQYATITFLPTYRIKERHRRQPKSKFRILRL